MRFEAKRKRAAESRHSRSSEWAIGGGYYVRATLPDGTVDRIEGFATEGEAGRWIKNESVVWLANRAHDEHKDEEKRLPAGATIP